MSDDTIFINRELSWLDFNRRVLALGKDKNVPLAERVKFLAIYGSNLDEFFMVRVGSLQERANLEQEQGKKVKRENKTNMSAAEQLAAIMPKTAQLQEECDKYYAKALEALAECGWRKVDLDHLSKEDEHFWKKYFQTELFPILSPQIVDNRHPFPFLRNQEIYLGVLLKEKHPAGQSLGIIPISSQMERMHVVKKDGETQFALTEELVLHFAASIFGKETIQEKCLFRVTRNADIDVKEGMMDHDIDYREIMTELLKRRRKLAAVRLQITPAPAPEVERLLCNRLLLTHKRVFEQKSPLDLSFFYKLTGRMEAEGRPELFYPAARPMLPPPDYDLAAEVQKHDVLLSYPYQSIRPFIAMLKKAAHDPEVISIKMTLYRMARESQIVQALMEAAENGKEVVALVELRARFDEQNNIDWSKQLESAGCTVIYGFDDYKVHSKLTLITKKSKEGYSYITQIGTGNYNEKTSELYTDYSFITADHGIGEEASNVFQNLAVQKLTDILQLQLRDNVNAREMRPDGSYQKVKPAEGEALVNGQMGMYELLKNDWTQPEPWRLSAAVQEKQPEPSAEAAKPEPAKTEAAPAAKQAEASHPESAAAPESGDRFDQLEQMVNHKKRTEPQPAPAAKPIKPVVVETPAPRSRLKRILDFFRLRR